MPIDTGSSVMSVKQAERTKEVTRMTARICENPWDDGCKSIATRMGLLHVANPSAEHPDGIRREVAVCGKHSVTWSALWGTWPMTYIPSEEEYVSAMEQASYLEHKLRMARSEAKVESIRAKREAV